MGSGKSTVGRLVAERAGARFLDLDSMIELAFGDTITRVFEREGEHVFRRKEAELLPRALDSAGVIALGGGSPIAGPNWDVIRERSLSVWLDAPFEVLWGRVSNVGSRPLLRGRGREEAERIFRSRVPRYAEADLRVDASKPPDEVAVEVLQLWKR